MLDNIIRPDPDRELAIARYRGLAPTYDAATDAIETIRHSAIAALRLRAGAVVFDVACGTGKSLPSLSEAVGPDGMVVGVEQSPDMAAQARARIERLGLENVILLNAPVEEAEFLCFADAVLLCYTHDVLRSAPALRNLFDAVRSGARISVAGMRLAPWWAAPVNLWLWWRARQYVTTFRGLRAPWRSLVPYCPDLRVIETFHLGTSYVAAGRAAPPRRG